MGELVGVPAEQVIAAIGVNAAQLTLGRGELEVVFKGVAGQGGVVGFDVDFEFVQQVVFAQEAQDGGGIVVVLVLGRLFGLGLYEQGAGKADCLFVFNGHVQEARELVLLVGHVGVEQAGVPFASTPKHVIGPPEPMGAFHGLLDLRCGPGEDVGVGVGGGPVRKARVRETVGRAPQQADACVGL